MVPTDPDHTFTETAAAQLRAERAQVAAQVAALARDDDALAAQQGTFESRPSSEGDGDSITVDRDLVARLGAKQQIALREIDAALAAIDAGTYGSCLVCGGAIPQERLEFRPRTLRCVPCASKR